MSYVTHPLVRPGAIEHREYQETILARAVGESTLVVLPTGLGKTVIAALLAAHVLTRHDGTILFLAPTKPLVMQHEETFARMLAIDRERLVTLTGTTPPAKREKLYEGATAIFATPQVIENDILSSRIDLSKVSLLIIDEAHRATGDYAYVYIARRYHELHPRPHILGITASPGYDRGHIRSVMDNLGVTNLHIEDESSPAVSPYIHETEVEWIKLDFPKGLESARAQLKTVYEQKLTMLLRFRLTTKPRQYINKRDLLKMGETLRGKLARNTGGGEVYTGLKAHAAAIKVSHALELLETQGPRAMLSYFDKVAKQKSKASRELMSDVRVTRAIELARSYDDEHPKIAALKKILSRLEEGQKAIVFSQFRETTQQVVEELGGMEGVKPIRFVGQASKEADEGLTQKRQKEVLESFRAGAYNVLVATSVAEEGLDIPNVDLVVFFEPIPSEIRTIQRRGRTGRRSMGRVVVLTMKDTMDEAYFNVARQKETKMHKALTQMGDGSVQQKREDRSQQQLDTYLASGEHELICDTRENPALLKLLSSRLTLKIVQLDVADYVVSDRVGVERKSTEDFLRSLFSNKLFEQMRALSHHYEVPVLLLEGPDLFSKHQAHASAIRSALISIMVDFRVQVMMTRDEHDSAAYLVDLVKRERKEKRRTPSMRQSKQARSLHDSQVYLLEGLPSVSSTLARRLLEHFDTVERVLTATEDELRQVQGVGPTIARSIRAVLETPVSRPQD